MIDYGSFDMFGPNGISHIGNGFNGSFGHEVVDCGQYLTVQTESAQFTL